MTNLPRIPQTATTSTIVSDPVAGAGHGGAGVPRTRSVRRRARILGGTIAVGIAALGTLASAPARALPPPEPTDPPPPSTTQPGTYSINGRVNLVNCPGVARTSVQVMIASTSPNSDDSGAVNPDAAGVFHMSGVHRGTYRIVPSLPSGVCPYGVWSPTSVTAAASTSTTTTQANFTYTGPTKVVKVSAVVVAAKLNEMLSQAQIHLGNYGPQHEQSHQLDFGSWVQFGTRRFQFTLPEFQYDLSKCWGACDVGQARFYVDNMNLTSLRVSWLSQSMQALAKFESYGHEVKGWWTDASTDAESDNAMPDVNIDNAQLDIRIHPAAAGGKLSYVVGPVHLTADIQATGGCNFPGGDPCDFFTDYKAKVKQAIENGVGAKLSDPTLKALASARMTQYAASVGMSTVNRVYVEGDTIVLVQ